MWKLTLAIEFQGEIWTESFTTFGNAAKDAVHAVKDVIDGRPDIELGRIVSFSASLVVDLEQRQTGK